MICDKCKKDLDIKSVRYTIPNIKGRVCRWCWRKWRESLVPELRERRLIGNRQYIKEHPELLELNRLRYHKNPRKHKDRILRSTYGISMDDYESLIKNQNGKCAICFREVKILNVDHNHQTNKIRGLLCNKHNLALGQFEDSIELLQNAIDYLKRNT